MRTTPGNNFEPQLTMARHIIDRFSPEDERLALGNGPEYLRSLGKELGVKDILLRPMTAGKDKHPSVDAMLVPLPGGYSVVIDEKAPESRQRYSLAHELAHIMLLELDPTSEELPKVPRFRTAAAEDEKWKAEERLCDEIAAELLMPEKLFSAEVANMGHSLRHLPRLAGRFQASLTAAAIRYWELLPEPCQLFRWRRPEGNIQQLKPDWQMRNKIPGISISPVTALSIARRNEFNAVRENWRTLRFLFSYELLLAKCKANKESHIQPLMFETEHIGFGGPSNRTVFSAVYLDPDLCN